jgi:hypothetical protein
MLLIIIIVGMFLDLLYKYKHLTVFLEKSISYKNGDYQNNINERPLGIQRFVQINDTIQSH